jgi:hypothetical protein
LDERVSMLRYNYIACLVITNYYEPIIMLITNGSDEVLQSGALSGIFCSSASCDLFRGAKNKVHWEVGEGSSIAP